MVAIRFGYFVAFGPINLHAMKNAGVPLEDFEAYLRNLPEVVRPVVLRVRAVKSHVLFIGVPGAELEHGQTYAAPAQNAVSADELSRELAAVETARDALSALTDKFGVQNAFDPNIRARIGYADCFRSIVRSASEAAGLYEKILFPDRFPGGYRSWFCMAPVYVSDGHLRQLERMDFLSLLHIKDKKLSDRVQTIRVLVSRQVLSDTFPRNYLGPGELITKDGEDFLRVSGTDYALAPQTQAEQESGWGFKWGLFQILRTLEEVFVQHESGQLSKEFGDIESTLYAPIMSADIKSVTEGIREAHRTWRSAVVLDEWFYS